MAIPPIDSSWPGETLLTLHQRRLDSCPLKDSGDPHRGEYPPGR
jgi:hypothetical protein